MFTELIGIVENDAILTMDLKIVLKEMGFRVAFTTGSGETALQKLKNILPDLILMDIGLSGKMDGIETAHRIKALHNIPIVYLTASDNCERAQCTRPSGYLVKPYNEKNLRSAVQSIFENLHSARSEVCNLLLPASSSQFELPESPF